MLTLCWPKLTLSCPYVAPMVAYVAIASANPHSSDRKDGGDHGEKSVSLPQPPTWSGDPLPTSAFSVTAMGESIWKANIREHRVNIGAR